MKFLFDQNISFRVTNKFKDTFPESRQVRELSLEDKSDREIWDYAKREGFTIVTFDADFYDLVTLYGHPPKVVWLRMGNTKTDNLIAILLKHSELLVSFVLDLNYSKIGCIEVKS
jgi:predicted nuclease of predicted toxin-antitoxin system